MIVIPKKLVYSFATVLALLTTWNPQLQAQDDDDEPTVEHVLDFLKEKMPESMKLLKRVRAEEGEDEYNEVLEKAGELVMEYLEIKREEGVEDAEAFLKEERGRIRMEVLVEAWHETDDRKEKKELEAELAEIIGVQIDRELAHGRRELENLEEEVAEFEAELEDIEENRDLIVAEEVGAILSDDDDNRGEENHESESAEVRKFEEFSITQSWSQEKNFKRPYWVHVPAQEDAAKRKPMPVFILLHGNGGNAKGVRNLVFGRYPEVGREFITVFPQGYRESWNIVSERSKADDRGFIEAIIRELAKRDDVKKNDFTVMGISNGAALVNQIAIETTLPNIKNYISAVSPLNGYQHDGKNFKTMGEGNDYSAIAKPLSGKRVLNISGTNDPLIPYRGGPSKAIPAKGGKLSFVDAEESIFLWAKQMGYEGEQLNKPSEEKGEIEIFSYLDGDVVHFKVNEHGHNATLALSEQLLLNFLQEK